MKKDTSCIVCLAAERDGDGADGALFVLAWQWSPGGYFGQRFLLNRMCKRHARTLRYWLRLLRAKWKKIESGRKKATRKTGRRVPKPRT